MIKSTPSSILQILIVTNRINQDSTKSVERPERAAGIEKEERDDQKLSCK